MGTTAEKLTYLNTTKQKIKDAINNIGGNITSETTFRQYVAALESIYQSMPKVSGTGTSLSLTPTLKGLMQSTLKGNTSQVQLSGKNLFNINEYTNAILRGGGNAVALTKEDDITLKTLNKVSQTQNYCLIPIPNSNNLLGKTITISGNTTFNNVSTTTVNMYFISDGTYIGNNIFSKNLTSEGDFTLTGTIPSSYPSGATRLALGIYGSGSTAQPVNSYALWKNIQLEEGSTATPYEQYCGGVPSPNPSYPQDIHNVSGNNNIVVEGKNLFDKDTMVMNSAIDAGNGNMTSSDNFRTAYIKCKPNTTYSISKILSNRFVVGFTSDEDLTLPKTLTNVWSNQTITTKTITSPNNTYYMFITLSKITDDTTPIQDILDSLQVEINETATTYEAYNGTTYPINLPVENLFDKDNANMLNNMFINGSGVLTSGYGNTSLYIPCKPNTSYTISKIAGNVFRVGTCASTPVANTQLSNYTDNATGSKISITTASTSNYLVVFLRNVETAITLQDILNSLQIEKGLKANTYTPYGTTPIELNKIGTYQDYIYKENDKWYLHKEIGKYTFTGNESFSSVSEGYYMSFSGALSTSSRTIICNNYTNYLTYSPFVTSDYGISLLYSATQLYVRDKDISSASALKTKLANSGTYFYYKLETPTNTEITDTTLISQLEAIYNAKSKNGTTNINQENNDLPFILDVSALLGSGS